MRKLILSLLLMGVATSLPAQEPAKPEAIDPLSLVRRLYLRLNDRIPTPAELDQAIEEADINALTERLLTSPDFQRVLQNHWIEWLGITRQEDIAWIQGQVAENSTVEERLREWFNDQHIAADDELAMNLAERVGPTLFGDGFQCNRCHDHPFEVTTQREFLQLAGFFRKGGAVVVPANIYTTLEEGAALPGRTPEKFEPSRSVRLSRRATEHLVKGNVREADERKGLVEFGEWIGNFRENLAMERIWVAHFLTKFTADPSLLGEVFDSLDRRPPERMAPFFSTWRRSRYDEITLIRAIVESPEFVQRAPRLARGRQREMSADTWERSVLAALPPKKDAPTPKLQGTTLLERSVFLDAVLANLPASDTPTDLNQLWLYTLGRLPSEAEEMAAGDADTKDLYWILFLSDEFSRIP